MRKLAFVTTCTSLTLLTAAAGHATEADAERSAGLFGTSLLEGWTRNLGLGLSGTNGNSDEIKLIADAKGRYEDETHRRKFAAQYYISDTDVGPTDRKAYVEFEENWKLFGDSIFLLGIGRYDYDRFEAWDNRISASAGIGTDVISTESLKLRFSVGAGVSHTWDGLQETSPEGVVRLAVDYQVMEDVSFATTHTYYPNFDDTPEFRTISDAEFKADIGAEGGLTTSIGLTNEYDSLAEFKNNDLTYYVRFGYDF